MRRREKRDIKAVTEWSMYIHAHAEQSEDDDWLVAGYWLGWRWRLCGGGRWRAGSGGWWWWLLENTSAREEERDACGMYDVLC